MYVDCVYRLVILLSSATPPKGSTMSTIGSQCEVYMQVEGLVDFDKEIGRLEDAIRKKEQQRDRLLTQTQVEGYLEKVCHIGSKVIEVIRSKGHCGIVNNYSCYTVYIGTD